MFRYIFFNVYEILAVIAVLLIIGVLIFATRHRMKQDALEQQQDAKTKARPRQSEVRDVGLVSAGMANTYETNSNRRTKRKKPK
ncbi:hypothetical protein ROA7450_00943 [Roseovarius albus]|uniref:Uncharacterized protein n=1 Tax=Roseovarius albus TaxID=1247867 RepID=A0A1X6YK03_9RHOB|nr:hypothetical protein [Roseovarius albus]SLN23587.1 hypothetical protein ROA7450_00943 [Roseovarius albus]